MASKFTELHNVGSVFYARVSPQRAKIISDLQAAEVAKEQKGKTAEKQLKASKQQAIIDDVADFKWLTHPVKVGDTVVLETGETVGTVKSIQHGVGQSLLSVIPAVIPAQAGIHLETEKSEHLIPLVKDFIVSQTAGTLTMKLPEGLLDL